MSGGVSEFDEADNRKTDDDLDERRHKAAVLWVMSDKRGRLLLYRLLESAGVFRISYTGNADTNFREGGRNEGLKLMAMLEQYCPGAFLKLLKENRLNDAPDERVKKENTDG